MTTARTGRAAEFNRRPWAAEQPISYGTVSLTWTRPRPQAAKHAAAAARRPSGAHGSPRCGNLNPSAGPGLGTTASVWGSQPPGPGPLHSGAAPGPGLRGRVLSRLATGLAQAPTWAFGRKLPVHYRTRLPNTAPVELRQWHRGKKVVRDARLYFGREPRLHGHCRVLLSDPGPRRGQRWCRRPTSTGGYKRFPSAVRRYQQGGQTDGGGTAHRSRSKRTCLGACG